MAKKANKPKVAIQSVESGEMKRKRILQKGTEPYVIYSFKAREKIRHIVDAVATEVGWIGLIALDPKFPLEILVVDIELATQVVASTTCTMSALGKVEATDRLFDNNPDYPQAYIGYWGHSHVNMGVSPSGQDVDTAMENSDVKSMYVACIHNKKDDVNCDIYDFANNVWHEDVDVYTESYFTTEEVQTLNNQIKELLTKETYLPVNTYKPKTLPPAGYSFSDHSPATDKFGWQLAGGAEVLNDEWDDLDDVDYWKKWDEVNSL
jgi:hypothetical protein